MKHLICILTILVLLISSCATLNIDEIKDLQRTEFDTLQLNPDRETNNLRIDIIRQIEVEIVNDTTTETVDTPYNPIGFDLGNGLFFDLNQNLGLRIDYLLKFSPDHNFEITRMTRPERNRGIIVYKFRNDSLTVNYPSRKKAYYNYRRIVVNDSVSYKYKNRLNYSIVENDSSLIYYGKRRKLGAIRKLSENQYYQNSGRRKEEYQLRGNEIFLRKYFLVSLINNNKTLEIKRQGNRENRIFFTIEKSKDNIFIYNKKYSGIKIELKENNITIYQNKKQIARYILNMKTIGSRTSALEIN